MSRLKAFLKRHRRIALDTSVFIYHVEPSADYAALAEEVFRWLEKPGNAGVTSSITMTEVLVGPYRNGDETLALQYLGLFSTFPNLTWVAPDLEIADRAARLRARYRLRTPDAVQVATCICWGATGFLTNDSDLKRLTEVEVAWLAEMR